MKGFRCEFLYTIHPIKEKIILNTILHEYIVPTYSFFEHRVVNLSETLCAIRLIKSHLVREERLLLKCVGV